MDPRIEAARKKAFTLYEGVQTPHRSCGIALAETFGLPTAPYQAFRKGGITGLGPCGAIQAGLVILGELLGDPDPTGAVTPELKAAAVTYEQRWKAAFFGDNPHPDTVCNHLTEPLGEFMGERRKSFCTNLVAGVAAIVAETALEHGVEFEVDSG
ncbi:MAG: C-GCAxxG-C-C family protein [Planctomycetota bacterium]|nr:C-GCAxxG-C-C family protein [Planctomycetota bacterium]